MIKKLTVDFDMINIFKIFCSASTYFIYISRRIESVGERNGEYGASICAPMENDREIWEDKVKTTSMKKLKKF